MSHALRGRAVGPAGTMRSMPLPAFDHLLAPDYVKDLDGLAMEEVRTRRTSCQEAETTLSYLRRLVQGRLDIVQADLDRRSGGTPGDLAALVEQLPEILGGESRGSGMGRLQAVIAPAADATLTADLDDVLPPDRLALLTDLPEKEVREIAARLADLEIDLSARRKAMFDRIDALQEEIVRRYRTGEASVDSLLT